MKLNVKTMEPHYLEIELEGEEHSIPNALREILIEEKDVEFAAYKIPHPQVGKPQLYLRTKSKKAIDVLQEAVKKLRKDAEEFKDELKSAKKPKESKSK